MSHTGGSRQNRTHRCAGRGSLQWSHVQSVIVSARKKAAMRSTKATGSAAAPSGISSHVHAKLSKLVHMCLHVMQRVWRANIPCVRSVQGPSLPRFWPCHAATAAAPSSGARAAIGEPTWPDTWHSVAIVVASAIQTSLTSVCSPGRIQSCSTSINTRKNRPGTTPAFVSLGAHIMETMAPSSVANRPDGAPDKNQARKRGACERHCNKALMPHVFPTLASPQLCMYVPMI